MRTIQYGLFLMLVFTLNVPGYAKKNKNELPEPAFNEFALEQLLEQIKVKIIKQKQGKPILPTGYLGYANRVSALIDHPDLEKETRIQKKWYKKIILTLKNMYKSKMTIKIALMNKNRNEISQGESEYNKQIKKLEYILKHPDKIKKKKRRGSR